jgi:hypothetical protein
LEEITLRRVPLEMPVPELFPRRYTKAQRAAELWDKLGLSRGSYLLKFGHAVHLRALFEDGRIQISPASSYADPSLNSAIQDNELEFTQESVETTIAAPPEGDYSIPREQWIPVPLVGPVKYRYQQENTYYVSCLASQYEYRLYEDFGYDACLVIREPERFISKMKVCGEAALSGWCFRASPVTYLDPCHPIPDRDIDIPFIKHFKFAYQHEFRIVWEPPMMRPAHRTFHFTLSGSCGLRPKVSPQKRNEERDIKQQPLELIYITLGALTDYCDLLVL